MNILSIVKPASCKLECGGIKSSGFFVSSDTLLTCFHNIELNATISGETYGQNKKNIVLELVDSDTQLDLAILRVKDEYEHTNSLHVCTIEPIQGITWVSFGYPATNNGRIFGETIQGKIKDYSAHSGLPQHDIVLSVEGYNISTSEYQGFSGSPLVDDYGNVIAVLRHSSHNSLDAVSIKRAKTFLEKNKISYKQDYLMDFEEYSCNCFSGFEDNPKTMCNLHARKVRDQVRPEAIASDLLGKLYYPHKSGSLEDIIFYLKNNSKTNKGLWQGWLELLSYISMIPSTRPDFNSITITLTSENFAQLFGVHREIANRTIDVNLNFFWTEGEAYLKIISQYAQNKLKSLTDNNTCYIFNSSDRDFGRRPPKAGFKKSIINDISGDESAGLHIIKQMNFGMLSLNQLSQLILECDTEQEARPKIEQLFINAIQND